jgi:hypothetical protein
VVAVGLPAMPRPAILVGVGRMDGRLANMVEFTPATGFWSYARRDDVAMAGHVLELADQVRDTYHMKTSETITIFMDRNDIKWSQEWREKISTAILGTTFFFPVISPLYLKSPNCRQEFDEFWKAAKTSKVTKLLLPILYEDVDLENSKDPICEIVREINYVDWRKTKLEDRTSSSYRKLLDRMGADLVDAAVQAASAPEPDEEKPKEEVAQAPAVSEKKEDDEGGGGGVPPEPPPDMSPAGLLESLVRAQELNNEFIENLAKVRSAMDAVVAEITREPPPPNASAGQRLFYVNAISTRIREPAETFEMEAKNLERVTREMTDIVLMVAQDMANPVFAATVKKSDIEKLLGLRERVVQEFRDFEQARAVVTALGRMSRRMKESISAVERGFDSLGAIREMFLSWASAFEPVIAALTQHIAQDVASDAD